MYRLYGYHDSANSYKVVLLFHQLDIGLETIELDIEAGVTHTPTFREKNPFELTPVVEETQSGRTFVESNAILWHFGSGTDFGPADALLEYETLKWMFFEQNLLAASIGRARRPSLRPGLLDTPLTAQLNDRRAGASAALRLLDQAIGNRKFLFCDRYGIADIAVFAYAHVAPEGGIPLEPFPNVRRWIAAVESTPRFKSFAESRTASGPWRSTACLVSTSNSRTIPTPSN
jgi:glutathione S-transferase